MNGLRTLRWVACTLTTDAYGFRRHERCGTSVPPGAMDQRAPLDTVPGRIKAA